MYTSDVFTGCEQRFLLDTRHITSRVRAFTNIQSTLLAVYYRYDSRVKAMELDERPTEQYSDIGGLDKQIEEVCYHLLCVVYSL